MQTEYLDEPVFIDTSLLVYGYLSNEEGKNKLAKNIIKKVFDGRIKGYISNQVLAELSFTLSTKYKVGAKEIRTIANGLMLSSNWSILNYDAKTVIKTLERLETSPNLRFFDTLITETMKENLLYNILTENEKDFNRIPGIKVINPFKA